MDYYHIHFKLMMVAGLEKDEEKTSSNKTKAERSTTLQNVPLTCFLFVVFNDDSFHLLMMVVLVVAASI